MRNVIIGIILALVIVGCFKFCSDKEEFTVIENSKFITEQIKNVGKLVVTEGHFSDVYTYKDTKLVFGDLLEANKNAIVIVNADVSIGYDLSKIEYDIDDTNKILTIKNIPEEDIKISPDLEYYDIQADFLNPFESSDYNKIKKTVRTSMLEKIEASDFKKNAKNRLISELSKLLILTNSLGWTLQYNEIVIENESAMEALELIP